MVNVSVSINKIEFQQWLDNSSMPGFGAEIVFVGRVRDHNQGKSVSGINYDGFIPLAEKVLKIICEEAEARVRDQSGHQLNIVAEHRIGFLSVGDVSVAILVQSPHRDSAYSASRYIIEQIKQRLPIWKQEVYSNGEAQWLKGSSLR